MPTATTIDNILVCDIAYKFNFSVRVQVLSKGGCSYVPGAGYCVKD